MFGVGRTQALGYEPTEIERSIYEVLLNPAHGPAFAMIHTAHSADLVPATIALAGAELSWPGASGASCCCALLWPKSAAPMTYTS